MTVEILKVINGKKCFIGENVITSSKPVDDTDVFGEAYPLSQFGMGLVL